MKKLYTHQHIQIRRGFSLIELIAVIAVLGVVGTIIVSILVTVLRGSKKAELLTMVRQNGDFSLSQIVSSIRYAKSLDSPVACTPQVTTQSITITSLTDGGQTTYTCPANGSATIASNGASLVDQSSVAVSACSFICQQPAAGAPPLITIQFTLTPKNSNSLVENIGSLSFESTVTLRNYNQ